MTGLFRLWIGQGKLNMHPFHEFPVAIFGERIGHWILDHEREVHFLTELRSAGIDSQASLSASVASSNRFKKHLPMPSPLAILNRR
jgi:hypothetical protein